MFQDDSDTTFPFTKYEVGTYLLQMNQEVIEEIEYEINFKTNIGNPANCSISNSLLFETTIARYVFAVNNLKITLDTVDINTG